MIDTAQWIAGLMAENYEAISFIPDTTLRDRYITKHRYVLQLSERGQPVGYLLHGALNYGQPVFVSQACIQYEKRLRGYGEKSFIELLNRASFTGASSIHLTIADDLPAVQFWQSMGFRAVRVFYDGNRRQRMKIKMVYPLALPLFTTLHLPGGLTTKGNSPRSARRTMKGAAAQ